MVPNTPIPPDDTPELLECHRNHAPFMYLVHRIITQTHLRVCEVLNLDSQSIDVHAGTLTIQSPKTMTTRMVLLTPELTDALTIYLAESPSACRVLTTTGWRKLGPAYRTLVRRLRVRGPRSRRPPTQR